MMMRKVPLIVLALLAAGSVWAAPAPEPESRTTPRPASAIARRRPVGFALLRFGTFQPSASIFKDVYGSGRVFGGELRIRVLGGAYVSLDGGYFKKTGELTLTREPTTMTILPLDVTAVYHLRSGSLMPYVGAGVSAVSYKEENIIGKVSKSGFGFAACGGITARWRSFALDARAKYSTVKVKPFEEKVDLGGLTLSLGAGIGF